MIVSKDNHCSTEPLLFGADDAMDLRRHKAFQLQSKVTAKSLLTLTQDGVAGRGWVAFCTLYQFTESENIMIDT